MTMSHHHATATAGRTQTNSPRTAITAKPVACPYNTNQTRARTAMLDIIANMPKPIILIADADAYEAEGRSGYLVRTDGSVLLRSHARTVDQQAVAKNACRNETTTVAALRSLHLTTLANIIQNGFTPRQRGYGDAKMEWEYLGSDTAE